MSADAGRYPGRAPVDSYGNGGFRFAGMSHRGSILCLPSAVVAWDVSGVAGLREQDFAPVIAEAHEVELLLLGTGSTFAMPEPTVRRVLEQAGIGLEVMDTGAAIRTYNILLAEKRPVAAALIATPGGR